MASVTQCDVCGNVVKHEQSTYLTLHRVTTNDKLGNKIMDVELCSDCTEKVLKIIERSNK